MQLRMFPLRTMWALSRRSASISATQPTSLDSFVSNLSKAHVTERSEKGLQEIEKLIDVKKASSMDRLNYIIKLPINIKLNKQQLERFGDDSFAAGFSSTAFSKDELISAIDKIIKLRLTHIPAYKALLSTLSSIPPSSLRSAAICSLVETVSTIEETKGIEDEEWRSASKKIVAEVIKRSTVHTDLIYTLGRTNLWSSECIQAIKDNFNSMNFGQKVSLLSALSERGDIDKVFINTMVEEIANDSTALTLRQCVSLASNCIRLKLNSPRLKKKLIDETMASMSGLRKWNDMRTLMTVMTVWRVTDDALWKQLSMWTERNANIALFKDLATVVNMMGDLGRSEGALTASVLSERMCVEKGGDPLVWLSTMVSLSFYSTIDHRSIESVLNPVFIQEVLANSPDKRSLVIRLLMQVDYYASTLESYSGPRLKESFITDQDKMAIISSYNSRGDEVDAFRSCLSRVIVDPISCRPQVHPSGMTLEALFINPQGGEEAVVFVPSDKCAKDGDGERLMGSSLLSLNCMHKKGIKVYTFTHREMESFNSQVEATIYIKKKIYSK